MIIRPIKWRVDFLISFFRFLSSFLFAFFCRNNSRNIPEIVEIKHNRYRYRPFFFVIKKSFEEKRFTFLFNNIYPNITPSFIYFEFFIKKNLIFSKYRVIIF